jgi:hypothetical protein
MSGLRHLAWRARLASAKKTTGRPPANPPHERGQKKVPLAGDGAESVFVVGDK